MAKKFPSEPVTLRNMEVLRTPFRNLSGGPTKYNPAGGARFFNVRLSEEQADALAADGWKVRSLPARDEQEMPLRFLEVKVSYKGRGPKIVKVTPVGKEDLPEDLVGLLDSADLEFVDLTIRPYVYDRDTAEFCTAYLQTAYFHIRMDELELQYAMEDVDGTEDDSDEVVCDDDGVCYLNGVRIN